ncbi:hypothetical protein FH620_26935 [Corallococcus exiguus]|nr:hypothetical protein FH620_26935 [Corallococcus exiguus]
MVANPSEKNQEGEVDSALVAARYHPSKATSLAVEPLNAIAPLVGRAVRHHSVPPVCPSSEVRGGTPGNSLEWVGTTNPSKSKAMAGNCASCLRFPIALPAGSNPAFGTSSPKEHGPPHGPSFTQNDASPHRPAVRACPARCGDRGSTSRARESPPRR